MSNRSQLAPPFDVTVQTIQHFAYFGPGSSSGVRPVIQ
jgi:hypothetical protein